MSRRDGRENSLPILRLRPNQGDGDVLMLDDENRTEWLVQIHGYYKTFYVTVIRAQRCQLLSKGKTSYTVHLTKDFQALDLLCAFEKYIESCGNTRLYQKDHEYIPREAWLGQMKDQTCLLLIEDGAVVWGERVVKSQNSFEFTPPNPVSQPSLAPNHEFANK